jgi:hypothetical protein
MRRRIATIGLTAMLLGCPESDIVDGLMLDMASCTLSSRLVANLNCGPGKLVCKQGVVEPTGCARLTWTKFGLGDCNAEEFARQVSWWRRGSPSLSESEVLELARNECRKPPEER